MDEIQVCVHHGPIRVLPDAQARLEFHREGLQKVDGDQLIQGSENSSVARISRPPRLSVIGNQVVVGDLSKQEGGFDK